MAWELRQDSGPYPGPWEGKDAVSWVWRIYRGDESRTVLVEVSGTAMSLAEEHLPAVTAGARATSGRSEVEKVLELEAPPERISLGSTGYLGVAPQYTTPDFLIKNAQGDLTAAVEVKNPDVLTLPAAAVVRDHLTPLSEALPSLRWVLVLSQNRGFLFDRNAAQYDPIAEFSMFEVVQSYFPPASREQRFRGNELAILLYQWLRDLTADVAEHREAETALDRAGLLNAISGGTIEANVA